jgi:hypothetical protein
VGVTAAELSAAEAFAAFAIAFWAGAVFPITGSGLGVVDAVLIAMLIELGSASDDPLVAAALLWRVFYSVIALPLGAITLGRFRKANPDALPRSRVPSAVSTKAPLRSLEPAASTPGCADDITPPVGDGAMSCIEWSPRSLGWFSSASSSSVAPVGTTNGRSRICIQQSLPV